MLVKVDGPFSRGWCGTSFCAKCPIFRQIGNDPNTVYMLSSSNWWSSPNLWPFFVGGTLAAMSDDRNEITSAAAGSHVTMSKFFFTLLWPLTIRFLFYPSTNSNWLLAYRVGFWCELGFALYFECYTYLVKTTTTQCITNETQWILNRSEYKLLNKDFFLKKEVV